MPFTERFQLLDLKRDEGARTFEAREIATGRPVLVHLFADRTSPWSRMLLKEIDALPEEERYRILERGEHEGGVYLVTDRLADYAGLREWLADKNAQRPKPLSAGGAWQIKPPVKASVDAQLASLFETAPRHVPEPSATEAPAAPVLTNTGEQTLQMPIHVEDPKLAEPAAPAITPAGDPGEFTRQFAPVLRPVPAPAAVPTAPASAVPPQDAGEFTRQFTAPPPAPQKPAGRSGEFTRLFQRPVATPVPPAPPSTASPTAPQPGEFTQMLQAQRLPAAPTTVSTQASQDGEFARYFQSPMAPGALPAVSNVPMAPLPSQPKGVGEFTQIFGRGDMPLPPAPPTAAAPPARASDGNATQVFATPRPSPPPFSSTVPTLPNPVQHPGQPLGHSMGQAQPPGEYTQMFSAPAALTFGQSPAASRGPQMAVPAPVVRNKSRLPLLLVIGAVVLILAAVVVYVMTRPRPA